MVTPKKSLSCEVKPVTSTEEYKRSHSIPIDGTLLGHSPKSPPAKEESKMASPSKGRCACTMKQGQKSKAKVIGGAEMCSRKIFLVIYS